MSNTFTLAEQPAETGEASIDEILAPISGETGSAPSDKASGWQPGAATIGQSAAAVKKPARAPKVKRVTKRERASVDALPYVPLPEEKEVKALTPKQQAKVDKLQLIKKREALAASIRINGTDDAEVEIPKKPFFVFFSGKRARPDEIAETLNDLASMLENGESERKAVEALSLAYADYDIGQAYERVMLLLDEGVELAHAMADQEENFPPVVRELIGAAQMPADTRRNLRRAALIIVEANDIKSKVRSALFKPGFMLAFLLIFTIVAIQVLLPMTASMFDGIGAETPALTQVIVAVGGWLKWVLAGVILLALIFSALWKMFLKNNERIASIADSLSLKAPLIGEVMRMAVAARFCDILAAGLHVGMNEIEALQTAGRAAGNRVLQRWVTEHIGRQEAGVVDFGGVAKTEILPWNFRNRIETATSAPRRIEILQELATSFHAKSHDRLQRFAERVGPLSEALVMGAVVAVVFLIISPILTFIPTLINNLG